MKQNVVILYNIRSVHNVGSIFRTADGAGVSKIYLVGYTPTPLDRFGRKRGDIAKVALGAEEKVSWEHCESIEEVMGKAREEGLPLIAVEQEGRSIDYREAALEVPVAFIFGNETEGLPKQVIDATDQVIEIKQYGTKESLNVSVSAGIILFYFV